MMQFRYVPPIRSFAPSKFLKRNFLTYYFLLNYEIIIIYTFLIISEVPTAQFRALEATSQGDA